MRIVTIVLAAAFVPMIAESIRSRRNERALRGAGAFEAPRDVYAVMQVAYPSCFLTIAAEGWIRGASFDLAFACGAIIFAAAKGLKYWAIAALGQRWTFRVLVLERVPLVTTGPYRYLRHPNYVGVAGELIGAALMAHAPVAGALSLVGFGALMLMRVRIEERALGVS